MAAMLLVAPTAWSQFTYEARIEGVSDLETLTVMQAVSETLTLPGETPLDPPASLLHLRRRASRDMARFQEVFHSRGYYGATVALKFNREVSPVVLLYKAKPGQQYVYGEITIVGVDLGEGSDIPLPGSKLGLIAGAPALAAPIASANGKILSHLRQHGYPNPNMAKRDVVVDKETQTVDVAFHVVPGPAATFGEARYEGLEKVRPSVLDDVLPWAKGGRFDQRLVNTLRTRLYDTGLFATAAVEVLPAEIGDDGVVPIKVTVAERPHRTMSAGLEYKSDEGIGTQFRWENRNMYGLGHDFSVETTLATELREVDLRYHIDRYRRLDQSLSASFVIAQEEREAFDSDRIQAVSFVEREVNPKLTLAAGIGVRVGRVEQLGETTNHELLYFPLEARLNYADDALDPTRGFRLRTRLEPYIDPIGELRYFAKTDLELSYYLSFGAFETSEKKTLPNWVLASRVRFGALVGESRDNIPADIRFYGGGGGSIRGYRFQTVSPLVGDDPIGGASLAEFSFEVRYRLSESIGLVGFIDGGAAFESSYPDFGSDIQYGAGVGVRYYTPLGPLRLDVAVPLNKRSEIDDAFQIYLSIGHAF